MSCTIQDYGWKKNGNWVDSYCRATTTDTIAMQARIYFSQAYGSVYLYFSIKKPDNTIGWYRYGYTASAAGTYTWDVTVGQFSTGPGTYYINEVQITDSNINTICSASGTPNNCRSLSVISNLPTTGTCDVYIKKYDTTEIVSGASVTISGITKTTDGNGFAGTWTLNATASGTWYSVTITKSGYENTSGNVLIKAGLLVTATYYIKPIAPTTGTCDVYIKDNNTSAFISGASVTIDGITKVTNSSGFAGTWTLNATSSGTAYAVTVTKSGYENGTYNAVVVAGLLRTRTYYMIPVVIPKYKCSVGICTRDDINGTFINDPSCGNTCVVLPTKYNCVSGQCQGPFDTGQYNSLTECQTARKYACINNSCTIVCPDYSGTKYNSLAECQAACIVTPTKYNCVYGQCQGPFDTGQYNSYADCVVACAVTQKWKCTDPATNTCAQASDGTFDTEAICKAAAACQPTGVQTWYCNTSTKVCSLQAGSGGYATKAACDAVCTGGGADPCDKCTSDQYCLFGQCIKKNDAHMAVGAVVLLLVLTKK